MNSLQTIPLSDYYRTGQNRIVEEFYLPCLTVSSEYCRAVGYFTSESLILASRGLTPFINHGGHLRLVASPHLSPQDAEAISEGYSLRELVESAVIAAVKKFETLPNRDAVKLLASLISYRYLDIKLAVVRRGNSLGLYHEKFGIFSDAADNAVAFVGSANETVGGLITNFESVEVFRSWIAGEVSRVKRRQLDFELLWEGNCEGVETFAFPDAAKQVLQRLASTKAFSTFVEFQESAEKDFLDMDPTRAEPELRAYQKEAIGNWFRAGARGYWRMATGTGKTITALSGAKRLAAGLQDLGTPLLIIVLVPYQHLVDQWNDEAQAYGFQPALCYRAKRLWHAALSHRVRGVNAGVVPGAMAIVTYATFATPAFQDVLNSVRSPLLMVVDEVHNAGSATLSKLLPTSAQYRLGLSATPERWFDDEGTNAIREYFGSEVFTLEMREAIRIGALTPYRYFVHTVQLNDDEAERYVAVSRQISRIAPLAEIANAESHADEHLKALLIKRARIIALAANKLPALADLVNADPDSCFNLIYCGDGSVEYGSDESVMRQVDAVVHMLGSRGLRVNSYTAETGLDDRNRMREMFSACRIQYLVAIRCLDEGVDIPATARAFFLASSTNPKQFIQRRGRVLRRFPGKEFAEIHDFVTVLPAGEEATYDIERGLVRRELGRISLFADLAVNGPQVKASLLDLYKYYNLLELLSS